MQPLQLPEERSSTCECRASGSAIAFLAGSPRARYPKPILIFGPTGAVGLVYYDSNPPQHLQSTLYLLIGRATAWRIFSLPQIKTSCTISSMWVAVGPQSGLVATAENTVTSPTLFQSLANTPSRLRAWEGADMTRSARFTKAGAKTRRGITLLEVLISMFVALVGLSGLAALFWLGGIEMSEGAKLDRAMGVARAAQRSLKLLGMLRPIQTYTSAPLPPPRQCRRG